MSTKLKSESTLITPVFRVSYPNVFKPKRNDLSGKDEYSVVMLFDKKTAKTELKELYALAKKAAEDKWGVGKIPKKLKTPFKDGDQKNADLIADGKNANPTYEGMIFINAKSTYAPGVVNAKREIILDASEFYGGCYARAQVSVYAYDTKGNQGVAIGLRHIQKVKDGDPFGNRTSPEDAFSPIDETTSLADNTANDDPFA